MLTFEAFKILNNLKPTSLHQAKWISAAIERFVRRHPELWPKIDAFYKELDEIEPDEEWFRSVIGGCL